eukprot:2267927-Heterocapsa_arctica.AAC.1
MLERVVEAQKWPLKLRCCAKLSAFCEESDGGSEDTRRPFEHLQKPSKAFKPLVHLCVHL